MPNSKLAGCVRTATDADHTVRAAVNRAWAETEAKGVCPTCRAIETGEATATEQSLLLFEDEHSFAVLERFPRGLGHTIVIAKRHIADIAELPDALGCHLMRAMLRLTRALKEATGCEKVYQVTMCSGALSHLHFQLLPRQPGERIGGTVFSTPRMVLGDARPLAAAVKQALECQSGSQGAGPVSVEDSR